MKEILINVDLSDPELLPSYLKKNLYEFSDVCREYDFFEQVVESKGVMQLVRELNTYCMERRVIGVHFTRSDMFSIEKKGLLCRDGLDIRADFVADYGHLFTDGELAFLKERWDKYFTGNQSLSRNNKVFFNFTESSLYDGGATNLLGLYGGEQVSMGFDINHPIGKKLSNIGQSLIVRCSLDPSQLNTFIEYPWGRILFSAYHRSINKSACVIDQDGYQLLPVNPEFIIDVKEIEYTPV